MRNMTTDRAITRMSDRVLRQLQRIGTNMAREMRDTQARVDALERRVQLLERRPGRPPRVAADADDQLRAIVNYALGPRRGKD